MSKSSRGEAECSSVLPDAESVNETEKVGSTSAMNRSSNGKTEPDAPASDDEFLYSCPCTSPMKPTEGPDLRWTSQHLAQMASMKSAEPEVVFLGDSIVQHLGQQSVWNNWFQPLHCVNLGISEAKTQHILWRLKQGLLNGLNPKVIILHVGTFHDEDEPVDDIASGIVAIQRKISQKLPECMVMIVDIIPRGEAPNPFRQRNELIMSIVRKRVADERMVEVHDVGNIINSDGTIDKEMMPDYLIPSNCGYRILFEHIYYRLVSYLADFPEILI